MTDISNKYILFHKAVIVFTLFVFLSFLFINFYTLHIHVLNNDNQIVHSHIIKNKTTNEEQPNSHTHTESEYTFYLLISSITKYLDLFYVDLFLSLTVLFLITYFQFRVSQSKTILSFNLRAPPFILL